MTSPFTFQGSARGSRETGSSICMLRPEYNDFKDMAARATRQTLHEQSFSSYHHRAEREGKPPEMLRLPAAGPARPDLPDLPGEGASAAGRLRPPGCGGAGVV